MSEKRETPRERLRERLRRAGATETQSRRALVEADREEAIRTRMLKAEVKALTAQIRELRRQGSTDPTPHAAGVDRRPHIRDEVLSAGAGDGALADLTDMLGGLQSVARQMLWTLGIGVGVVVPSVLIVLVVIVLNATD